MKHLYFYIIVTALSSLIIGCSSYPLSSNTVTLDGGWISKDSSYIKVVHYGTSRIDRCNSNACDNDLLRLNSGSSRSDDQVRYGRASVRIPYSKEIGGTSGMSLVDLEHDISWVDFILIRANTLHRKFS